MQRRVDPPLAATRCNPLSLFVLLPALVYVSTPSYAADPKDILPGYEFATWMGTGLYDIGNEQVWYITAPLDHKLHEGKAKISAFYVLSQFSDSADFATSLDSDQFNLGTVNELGFAVGVREPFKLFGLKVEWLGLSLVKGDNLEGIRINSGFPL